MKRQRPKSALGRWYQWRLRTLTLITFFIALALGWWVDRSSLSRQLHNRSLKQTKVLAVIHSDLESLAQDVREIFAKDHLDAVHVGIDTASNTILVSASSRKLAIIEAVVEKLDTRAVCVKRGQPQRK